MSMTSEQVASALRAQAELICRQSLTNKYLTPEEISAAWDEFEKACLTELQAWAWAKAGA